MLMYGAEGLEIAERYNDWGVTAFVLTYRLSPRYGEDARMLDGTRAIQVVRAQCRRVEARSRRRSATSVSRRARTWGAPSLQAARAGDAERGATHSSA